MAIKTTYTRKQFLIDMLAGELSPEQRETAEKWLVALEKKSSAPRVNKTRAANEELAKAAVRAMVANADANINAAWLRDNVPGIGSAQKAVAVMNVAAEMGLVERYEENRKAFYRLAR